MIISLVSALINSYVAAYIMIAIRLGDSIIALLFLAVYSFDIFIKLPTNASIIMIYQYYTVSNGDLYIKISKG